LRGLGLALLLAGAPARAGTNVVLISLDTTRADALSCYGRLPGLAPTAPAEATPHLDALAREGLRFERFYATAPTTLSSHATLLTGLDPHQHGVPRNGFPLAEGVPTLATRLAGEGWDTIGVLGAAVLDSDLGLARGFRVYDDDVGAVTGAVATRADNVVTRALAAVDARPSTAPPLFLFAHFYDAHAPYDPPEPYRTRFAPQGYHGPFATSMEGRLLPLREAIAAGQADPLDVAAVNGLYQAEVAYVDAQVGELLQGLATRGLLDDAVVIVIADHGESVQTNAALAYTHGSGVTDDVVRVPLIVRSYGSNAIVRRGVVERSANMTCVAPTVERLVGLEPSLGQDCWQLVRPGPVNDTDGWPERPSPAAFAEATRPHVTASSTWNNVGLRRAVRVGEAQLFAGPSAGEPPMLIGVAERGTARHALRDLLAERLSAWDAVTPPFRSDDPTGALWQVLETLGYVDPVSDERTGP